MRRMAFDLPQNRIFPISSAEIRLDPAPHPFEIEHRHAIDRNWADEKRAKPELFDGQVALLSSLTYASEKVEGRCHIVRFSTFMWWRRLRPHPSAGHVFAHAVPVASDGMLVAIRMGAQTANAGMIYFAAGSFEPADFSGGRADIAFNMQREVMEETGLDLAAARAEERLFGLSGTTGTVLFQRYFLDQTAAELEHAIRDFVARDPDPEIEGPVVISDPDRLPAGLAPHMPAIVAWHFGT